VPDFNLSPRSGLERLAVPGRHRELVDEPGVTLALRTSVALASVIARRGGQEALAARVRGILDLDLPDRPRWAAAGPVALVWAGPGQWLAVDQGEEGAIFEDRLRRDFAGLASVSDQSDGRVLLRISGPSARAALAKGVMIDLHPRAFEPGDAALSQIAHIGVHFWQLDDAPTYELAVFRSFSAALWHGLMESAAEFGVAVEPDTGRAHAFTPPSS
jgi:sarcosine oxidase subunit gamma